MKKKSKQTLILAEIIGAFMILMGILSLITKNDLFSKIFYTLFFMTIIAAVLFVFFLFMAVREHKLK